MKIFSSQVTMTVHIQPRRQGPLTVDEQKQLTDFFVAIMDLRPKENRTKEENCYSQEIYCNNNSNYEPGNCRWVTPKENVANQRKKTNRIPQESNVI